MGSLRRIIYRIFRIVRFIFFALLVYGIAIIVFRQAYGIELPNPIRWLVNHWPSGLSFRG
jgi:hypothetical protein